MRLLIVRHADPDYSIDSPDTGWLGGSKASGRPSGADSGGGLLCIAAGACEGHGVPDLKKACRTAEPAAGCVNLPAGGTSGKGFRALCLGLAAGCVDGGAEVF